MTEDPAHLIRTETTPLPQSALWVARQVCAQLAGRTKAPPVNLYTRPVWALSRSLGGAIMYVMHKGRKQRKTKSWRLVLVFWG